MTARSKDIDILIVKSEIYTIVRTACGIKPLTIVLPIKQDNTKPLSRLLCQNRQHSSKYRYFMIIAPHR